jgi:Tol biopolymer transport system component
MIAPDGKTVFFTIGSQAGGLGDEIGVTTMDKRVIMRTTLSGTQALGYDDGRLYYVQQDGAVMAVPFDLRKLHTAGQSIATGDIVTMDARGARASLSSTGHLAFVAGSARKLPVVVGANGSTAAFNVTEREFDWPRYSPNGRDVAFTIAERGRSDIWIYHVGTGTFERLTTDGTTNDRPEWWPDGRSVIYRSNRAGDFAFWRQPADGSGKAERLTPALDVPVQEVVVTPDGKTMLLRVDTQKQARDILTMPVGGTTPQVFVGSAFDELTPRISPDGKWVAYTSNESGRDEIYIRAFPGPGGRVLISDGGGSEPLWSRDGKKVYYRRGQDISAASLTLGQEVTVTSRTPILSGSYAVNRLHPSYDVAPDGRLLMLRDSEGELQLTVVLNWAQAMRQRLGPVK